jgi:hypothetical protein
MKTSWRLGVWAAVIIGINGDNNFYDTLADFPTFKQIGNAEIYHIPTLYPSVTYTVANSVYLTVDGLKKTKTKTCGEAMAQGYVYYWRCAVCLDTVQLSVNPADENQPPIYDMASCNPFSNPQCQICYVGDPGTVVEITVHASDTGDPLGLIECLLFNERDCGVRSCSNGHYASTYLSINNDSFVSSNSNCIPCAPGTWLTCIDDDTCSYTIPSAPGTFDGGGEIYKPDGQEPVGSCFTCQSAGNGKVHYGQTPRKTIIDISSTTPLGWYCPGGDKPPVLCTAPFVGANEDNTGCVCSDGYYPDGSGACNECPPGSMCPNGQIMECPDDTYQNVPGSIICISCLSQDGTTNACEEESASLKMRKCIGVYKAQLPLCVGCNACIRPYSNSPAGVVQCY